MSNDARRTLTERVTGNLPEGIAALSEDDKQFLADALGNAKRAQRAELAAATEESLGYVPKLLRRPVRKAVGL
ncbi:hypothetical protein [Haloechinothrix halophila]|uniref:hypothetical protein n=1 Tax=Haloechinothrix halophila TaxID=1069073 RepID=UPI000417EBC5|nr:hypothetical protein [Haloechinothrix halophila]